MRHCLNNIKDLEALIVYRHSRFFYALNKGSKLEIKHMQEQKIPLAKELFNIHKKNLQCLKHVENTLKKLSVKFTTVCRTKLNKTMVKNKLIICVGGDGTMLETSHYIDKSYLLGVNPDKNSSIGAMCIAHKDNFLDIMHKILAGKIETTPLIRLKLKINGKEIKTLATNDILFCHKNPSLISRFSVMLNGKKESHRSSGIWISTPMGSTGGICSSGANPVSLKLNKAIFRMREPYLVNKSQPSLLFGEISAEQSLTLVSNMIDGRIFIDGPHKTINVSMGDLIEVSISNKPLYLYDGGTLEEIRKEIMARRSYITKIYGGSNE